MCEFTNKSNFFRKIESYYSATYTQKLILLRFTEENKRMEGIA